MKEWIVRVKIEKEYPMFEVFSKKELKKFFLENYKEIVELKMTMIDEEDAEVRRAIILSANADWLRSRQQ
jgi:hypothetical protein